MKSRPRPGKILAKIGGAWAACILLVVLVLLFENTRAKRAWEKHQREAETRGAKFGWENFIPPQIPDSENFAATPLFMGLFERDAEKRDQYKEELKQRLSLEPVSSGETKPKGSWMVGMKVDLTAWGHYLGEADLLVALQKFKAELAEIARAAERPGVRFPLDYSQGVSMPLPHLSTFISLANILRLRAVAAIEAGQKEQALQDIDLIFRLGDLSTQNEATLITALVQTSVVGIGLQPVWEGLVAHQWSEDQLIRLQERLQQIDLLEVSRRAFARERTGSPLFIRQLIENPQLFSKDRWVIFAVPKVKAIFYQNMLLSDRLFEGYLIPSVDVDARRIYPQKDTQIPDLMAKYASSFPPYRMFADLSNCSTRGIVSRLGTGQTYLDEAVIACALERYRLREGKFPEQLHTLVPHYLTKLPHDLLTGEPLRYRPTEDGGYLLYSVGENGTDDGGLIATNENGRPDIENGDWVWKMPEAVDAADVNPEELTQSTAP